MWPLILQRRDRVTCAIQGAQCTSTLRLFGPSVFFSIHFASFWSLYLHFRTRNYLLLCSQFIRPRVLCFDFLFLPWIAEERSHFDLIHICHTMTIAISLRSLFKYTSMAQSRINCVEWHAICVKSLSLWLFIIFIAYLMCARELIVSHICIWFLFFVLYPSSDNMCSVFCHCCYALMASGSNWIISLCATAYFGKNNRATECVATTSEK